MDDQPDQHEQQDGNQDHNCDQELGYPRSSKPHIEIQRLMVGEIGSGTKTQTLSWTPLRDLFQCRKIGGTGFGASDRFHL